MSARFGTPTASHGSGTEDELHAALDQWRAAGSPWILFYFHGQPRLSAEPEDVKQ